MLRPNIFLRTIGAMVIVIIALIVSPQATLGQDEYKTQKYIISGVSDTSNREQITRTGVIIEATGDDWFQVEATIQDITELEKLGYTIEILPSSISELPANVTLSELGFKIYLPVITNSGADSSGVSINTVGTTVFVGGYTNQLSVDQGTDIDFHISTDQSTYNLTIWREGATRQLMKTVTGLSGVEHDCTDGYDDGCGWPVSYTLSVPTSWPSGIYTVDIPTSYGTQYIIFWVRENNPGSTSSMLFLSSVNTYNAYNRYGGQSLYNDDQGNRSHKVSFNRPFRFDGLGEFERWEKQFVTWGEGAGYTFEYGTTAELEFTPNLLDDYDVMIIAGHSEYWSWPMRQAVKDFVSNGGRFINLSGNTMWWQVRFEDNGRTMIGYKDHALDPASGAANVTDKTWDYPVFDAEAAITGAFWKDGGYYDHSSDYTFKHQDGYGGHWVYEANHWLFANTGLSNGSIIGRTNNLDTDMIGYESDGTPFNCATDGQTILSPMINTGTPDNYTILSIAPVSAGGRVGMTNMGIYTHPSGGAVFSGNTVGWANALSEDPALAQLAHNLINQFVAGNVPREPVRTTDSNYLFYDRFNCTNLYQNGVLNTYSGQEWYNGVPNLPYVYTSEWDYNNVEYTNACGVDGAGLKLTVDNQNNFNFITQLQPGWQDTNTLHSRVFINFSNLNMSNGEQFVLFNQVYDNRVSTNLDNQAQLEVRKESDQISIRFVDTPTSQATSWVNVPTNQFVLVETAIDQPNDTLSLWIDDVQYDVSVTLSGRPQLNRVDLTLEALDAGTSGYLCLDELVYDDLRVGTSVSTVDESLKGYWTLDEMSGQRQDSSGQGNHLADLTGVGSTSGPINNAATFDILNHEYLSIDDSSQTGLDITGSLTLMGWMKLNKPWLRQIMISKYDQIDDERSYEFFVSGKAFNFTVSPNGNYNNNFKLVVEPSTPIIADTWYHVAAVFDADAQTLSIYVDGTLIGTKAVSYNSIHNSTAPFLLGADMGLGYIDEYFDGSLDEWRVFARALTHGEIADFSSEGAPPASVPPTPLPPPPPRVPVACNPTGGSGGLAPGSNVLTTVGGLSTNVVVGDGYDANTPTYLGFFLHGDGGNYSRFTDANNAVTKWVNQEDWILVSPQSPNGSEWWINFNGDHVLAFSQVLDEMFANYNVCRDVVFGSSGSGGSEFLTSQFFPQKGGDYPAHTVLGCGGGQALGDSATRKELVLLGQDFDVVNRSTFNFVYGTNDYLYGSIQGSVGLYNYGGFHVNEEILDGAGHCNEWTGAGLPSLSEQIATHWEETIADLGLGSPMADFISTSPDALGEPTTFANTSSGSNLDYTWSFGDGSSSTDTNPSHTYVTTGTFTVVLTATNLLGSDTTSSQVFITDAGQSVVSQFFFSFENPGPYAIGSTPNVYNEDIVTFDGGDFSMLFDGSDVGVVGNVDAVHIVDPDTLLFSVRAATSLGNLGTVEDTDIIQFDATTFGATTTGVFSLYFDGSDVGLSISNDDIDAMAVLPDGRIVISTVGTPSFGGVSARDEDLLVFTPSSLGDNTSGTWAMYFDGSDVGLNTSSTENVNGVTVSDAGEIYLSTIGDFAVSGLSGGPEDVFVCNPISLGDTTACTFSSALAFDGSEWALTGNEIGGLSLQGAAPSMTSPTANFTSSTPDDLGEMTTFINTSSGTDNTYLWDFGDGSVASTAMNPTHTYGMTGTFTVIMTATNSLGHNAIAKTVTINPPTVVVDPISDLAVFNDSPTTLGQVTTFSSTLTTGNFVNYEWNLGDGTIILNDSPFLSYTYNTLGEFTTIVTASNWISSDVATTIVTIDDNIPVVSFVHNAPHRLGMTTSFTNTSSGTNLSYEWNFGDGSPLSTAENPTHTYLTSDTFTVVMTATNSQGSDSHSDTVTITTPAPIEGVAIQDSSPTTLGDVTHLLVTLTDGEDVSYVWNLGDGSAQVEADSVFSYTYGAVGEYTVVATATNSVSSEVTTTTVTIIDEVPIAHFSHDSPVRLGDPINFANGSTGTNLSYEWAFGDGSSSVDVNPTYTYATTGTYTVVLTAENSVGINQYSDTVTVTDPAQLISGLAALNDGPTVVGDATTLSATVESGSDVSYLWSFGNGQNGVGASVIHTYTEPGHFTATVLASSEVGVAMTQTIVVIVDEPPVARFRSNSFTELGQPTSFANNSTGTNLDYTWNFGDGATSSEETPSYTYSSAGNYTVLLTATNSSGVAVATQNVIIFAPANPLLYLTFSSGSAYNLGAVTVQNEDIVSYDGSEFAMVFDGSDVGVVPSVDAFTIVDEDTILMSFRSNTTVGGLSVTDADIVQFDATSLGETTAGTFSLYFDGSDVDLTSSGEDIDGIDLLDDGRLLISTTGNPSVSGLSGLRDEDILVFTPSSLGIHTAGTWAMYFDAGDVGLTTSNEGINGLAYTDDGNLYLSTVGSFALIGLSGEDEDVFACELTSTGNTTNCTYDPALIFDGDAFGLSGNELDGLDYSGAPSEPAPIAGFTSTSPDEVGEVTNFTNTTTGANVIYQWSFGDGATSTAVNPTHTYVEAGDYTVVMTATSIGGVDTASAIVSITTPPPPPEPITGLAASNNGPTELGQSTLFSAGVISGTDVSYLWSFGDGQNGVGANASHTYAQTGFYTATVFASNDVSNDTATTWVTVVDEPPVAIFSSNGPTQLGEATRFTNNSIGSNLSYVWSFGDGSTSNLVNPTHTYAATGTFTVLMTATNTAGSSVMSEQVTIISPPVQNTPTLYLTFSSGASYNLGNVTSGQNEDIVSYDGTDFEMVFDGSDVGVVPSVDAFKIVDEDTILMSFRSSTTVGGLTVTDADIVQFDATSLGETTAGTFSLYFDGSDVDLTSSGEDIDGIDLLDDGRLLISTTGNPSVSGLSGLRDEDILAFTPSNLGANTAGTWTMYFDAGDVGLTTSNEGINGLAYTDDGNLYLSTVGSFAVTGLSGDDEDVFSCELTNAGAATTCIYDSNLIFDGDAFGLSGNELDGLDYSGSGGGSPTEPAPVASFTTSSPDIVGEVISFFNSTTGTNVSYEWNFGNGATSTLVNPGVSYAVAGDYTVVMTATNRGGSDVATAIVTILDEAPLAGFISSSPDSLGQVTSFTNDSLGIDLSYEWSFGDGATSTLQNPTHTYAAEGVYTVVMTATNSAGSSTVSGQVVITSPPIQNTPSLYLTFANGGSYSVDGVAGVQNEDIVSYDGTDFEMVFDGSDVGVVPSVDAFTIVDEDTILLSVRADTTLGGLAVDDADIVQFDATSLGDTTAGTFSMYFDGSDVEFDTSSEDIDGFELLDDGRLLMSVTGNPSVTGLSSLRDEDILAFTPSSLGSNTAGTWSLYLEGSDVDLTDSNEDVNGLAYTTDGNLYLSTIGAFAVSGVNGDDEDVFSCELTSEGANTVCTYDSSLTFDGDVFGLSGNEIDGLSLFAPSPVATLIEPAPVAGFSSSSPDDLGQVTSFTNSTTGSNVSYEWSFGDGATSIAENPTHTYVSTGTFTVVLTATNSGGSDTASKQVIIEALPPVDDPISGLSIASSSPTEIGQTTALSVTVSGGTNITYDWNLGDGTVLLDGGINVSHTYGQTGTFTVVATATNGVGRETASIVVEVVEIPASPPADAPISGLNVESNSPTEIGQKTALSVTVSGGTNITYDWNLGDGTVIANGSMNVSHTYGQTGTYTVVATATNNLGTETASTVVEVPASPPADDPISGLSIESSGPTEIGQTTALSVTVSGGTNISYAWNLGDGTVLLDGSANLNHTYGLTGTYTVMVTATNGVGSEVSTIDVSVIVLPPVASFSSSSPNLLNGVTSLTNTSTGTNLMYSWAFGDGETSSVQNPTHTYSLTGTYTIFLTVTNSIGQDTTSSQVVIE